MRGLLLGGICLVFTAVMASLFLVWPNTYLSQLNISYWPKPLVRYFLEKKFSGSINLSLDTETKQIKFSDLGISLDVDQTMERLEKSKKLGEFSMIQPVFKIAEDFEKLAEELILGKEEIKEEVNYSKETGVFVYTINRKDTMINTVDLLHKLITFSSIRNEPIKVESIIEATAIEKEVQEANLKLAKFFSIPLEIIDERKNKTFNLNHEEVLSLITAERKETSKNIDFVVNKEILNKLLKDNGVNNASTDWISENIKKALSERYEKAISTPVVLGADDGPNTDGSVADKYIEVDLSQQKMYLFENGSIYKAYPVSTGLNYPTPVGNFKIKNKSPIGYSGIFGVYMPWWMAFDYREDIGAYLGIHELPYKLVEGEKLYRFGNYIGRRKTGGCIALAPGDSKEVYDKSFSGMDLVIYQ